MMRYSEVHDVDSLEFISVTLRSLPSKFFPLRQSPANLPFDGEMLTSGSRVLFQNLSSSVVKKLPAFMEPGCSLPHWQKPNFVTVLSQFSPVFDTMVCCLKMHSIIILPSTPRSFKWFICAQKICAPALFPMHARCPFCFILGFITWRSYLCKIKYNKTTINYILKDGKSGTSFNLLLVSFECSFYCRSSTSNYGPRNWWNDVC